MLAGATWHLSGLGRNDRSRSFLAEHIRDGQALEQLVIGQGADGMLPSRFGHGMVVLCRLGPGDPWDRTGG
jgi:hypothetical protein